MGKIRKLSETGIYHVYLRGGSRRCIFYDAADRILFCNTVNRFALKYDVKIFAYALMDNHVHLLLRSNELSVFMGALMISYVRRFNQKYYFSNNLCSRFGSSSKVTASKLRECILYILGNPLKAGMCSDVSQYRWTSFNSLYRDIAIDEMFIQLYFESYEKLRSEVNSLQFSGDKEINDKEDIFYKTTFCELSDLLNKILNGRKIALLSKTELNDVKNELLDKSSATYTQVAQLLNVSYKFVRSGSPR